MKAILTFWKATFSKGFLQWTFLKHFLFSGFFPWNQFSSPHGRSSPQLWIQEFAVGGTTHTLGPIQDQEGGGALPFEELPLLNPLNFLEINPMDFATPFRADLARFC